MTKKNLCLIASLMLLLLALQNLSAQVGCTVRSFGLEDGLSQVTINDLVLDDEGFLWIATQNGTNKFDGQLFKHYKVDETNVHGPSSNSPEHLTKDKNGRIWIGTRDAGLSYYSPSEESFNSYFLPVDKQWVTSLDYAKEKNELLVGTASNGLFVVKLGEDSLPYEQFLQGLPISGLNQIDNKIFIGTSDGKVFKKTSGADFELIVDIQSAIYAFYSFQENLLICSEDGLYIFDQLKNENRKVELESGTDNQSRHLRAFLKHNESQVWIASGNGLFLFDLLQEKSIQKISNAGENEQLLSNNTIHSLAKVSDNILAVGTANNLDILDFSQGHFKNISKDRLGKHQLNDNVIFSILKHEEDLWVGTTDGGLNLIRNGKSFYYYKNQAQGKDIDGTLRAIKVDAKNNRLWVAGTRGLYMAKLPIRNPEQVKFRVFKHDPEDRNTIRQDFIRDIDIDDQGRVWGAMSGQGVFCLEMDDRGFVTVSNYSNLDDMTPLVGNVAQVVRCHMDKVWVGFQEGLSIIGKNEVQNFTHEENDENSLSHNSILDIQIDGNGTPWIACRNGINKFLGDGNFKNWIGTGGQPSTIIYGIQNDDNGRIWMGTGNGIIRFDPIKESFTTYTKEDGIQSNEFDSHARFKDKDGNIYLGGIEGLTYFHPSDLEGMDNPRPLYFSNLVLQGRQSADKNTRDFAAGQSIAKIKNVKIRTMDFPFNLEFSSLNFKEMGSVDFAYRLLPNNENWTFLEKGDQEIQFVNLPSGRSKLEINGFSRGKVWTTAPLTLEIQVIPLWWKRWWAFLLYSVIGIALIYYIYRYQLSKKLLVAESARLKELDVLKNEFYASITHEFRTPLTIIMGMVDNLKSTSQSNESKKNIEQIGKNSDSLLKLVNEILSLVKLENSKVSLNLVQGNVVSLLSYIVESLKYLAKTKSIDLVFYAEQNEITMDYDPERLTTVMTNLISNAIKFTPENGKVFVHTSAIEKSGNPYLSINVKDNGRGIIKEDLPFIFKKYFQSNAQGEMANQGNGIGLALTKELVKAMDGEISAESTENAGSTFKVEIPISNEATIEEFLPVPLSTKEYSAKKDARFPHEMDPTLPLVLVVEDNEDVASYIISCLNNYNVVLASNGVQGKEIAELRIPEIIISDIMMPEMGGFELCKILKTNIKTDHIPIILLTAKATEKDKVLGYMYGADAYLTKPFSKIELIARIDQLIASRKNILTKVKNQGIESFIRENREDPSLKFLNMAVAAIHSNIDNTLFGPPLFAKKMGMSESQLYKKLKATTGKSTALFIRSIRLEKAKLLLLSTKKSVSEISYETGFNDPSWFSRAFKSEFGYSPSEVGNSSKQT